MVGYTIRSVSDEGTYYLVKNWKRNKAVWVTRDKLKQEYLYTKMYYAIRALDKLLKEMPEYREDELTGYIFLNDKEGPLNIRIPQ